VTADHGTGTAVPELLREDSSRAEELPSLPSCLRVPPNARAACLAYASTNPSGNAFGTGVLSSRDTKARRNEGSCSVAANPVTADHGTGTAVPELLREDSSRAEELPSLPSCLRVPPNARAAGLAYASTNQVCCDGPDWRGRRRRIEEPRGPPRDGRLVPQRGRARTARATARTRSRVVRRAARGRGVTSLGGFDVPESGERLLASFAVPESAVTSMAGFAPTPSGPERGS
jgi:hypothetical protein